MLRAEQLREPPALFSGHELLKAANQLVVNKDLGESHHTCLLAQRDAAFGVHAEAYLLERYFARAE